MTARGRALTGVVGLLLAAAAATPSSASSIEEARALLAAGERGRARAVLDSLLAAPEGLDPDTREYAGRLRAGLEEDGAVYGERLRALLEESPGKAREARLRFALGHLHYARGELETALREFRLVRELGREEEGALWAGLSALALGDGPVAREALLQASLSGNRTLRARAHAALGDLHRLAEEWDTALDHYREAAAGGPESSAWWPSATLRAAECLTVLDDPEKADRVLEDLLQRMPDSYEAPEARSRLRALRSAAAGPPAEAGPEVPGPAEEGTASADSVAAPPPSITLFSVQVGAFTLRDNARALAAAVEGRGFGPVLVADGEDGLHRVLVGRYPDRPRAESAGDSLGTALGVGFTVVAVEDD